MQRVGELRKRSAADWGRNVSIWPVPQLTAFVLSSDGTEAHVDRRTCQCARSNKRPADAPDTYSFWWIAPRTARQLGRRLEAVSRTGMAIAGLAETPTT